MLTLPTSVGTSFSCATTTVDSVTCIDLGTGPIRTTKNSEKKIYSCFAKDTESLIVPHCVVEFKAPGIALEVSERQMILGMVSAANVRHSLSIPGQFVFGILRGGGSLVQVYGARWESTGAGPNAGEEVSCWILFTFAAFDNALDTQVSVRDIRPPGTIRYSSILPFDAINDVWPRTTRTRSQESI